MKQYLIRNLMFNVCEAWRVYLAKRSGKHGRRGAWSFVAGRSTAIVALLAERVVDGSRRCRGGRRRRDGAYGRRLALGRRVATAGDRQRQEAQTRACLRRRHLRWLALRRFQPVRRRLRRLPRRWLCVVGRKSGRRCRRWRHQRCLRQVRSVPSIRPKICYRTISYNIMWLSTSLVIDN